MFSSHRDHGLENLETNVDTIDLTLSSPEPEQRPRVLPQQSQLPHFFKSEPRVSGPTHIKNERQRPGASVRTGTPHQARPVNPHHLAQIINTCDSHALKKVLLDLCKLSPALSGAVVRGLAVHSARAHGVVKQHRRSQQTSTPRQRSEWDDGDSTERIRKRFSVPSRAIPANSRLSGSLGGDLKSSFSTVPHQSVAYPRVESSVSKPQIKRDNSSGPLGSDEDDYDVHVPGSFPRSAQGKIVARPKLLNMNGDPSAASYTPKPQSIAEQMSNSQRGKLQEPRRCIQCHDLFTGEDDVCIYHPGQRIQRDGCVDLWTCCNEPASDLGCQFGSHISPAATSNIPPSLIPSSSKPRRCLQCKEPFLGAYEGCQYHPGRKIKREGSMASWSCCAKPVNTTGCQSGLHIDPGMGYKRPSVSPSISKAQQKKPKVL